MAEGQKYGGGHGAHCILIPVSVLFSMLEKVGGEGGHQCSAPSGPPAPDPEIKTSQRYLIHLKLGSFDVSL